MVVEATSSTGNSPPKGLATENIKTLRLLHQLLMVVSAAILAFALRPDQSSDYKAALNELASLKQVSFGGWSNYVAQHYKKETDRDAKFVLGVVRQAGIHVKGTLNVVIPVFGDQVPYLNSRLLDLDTFFAKPQKIGFMKFSTERQPMLEQFTKWKTGRNPNVEITALNVNAGSPYTQYPGGSLMLDWLNRSPSGTSSASMYIVTDEPGSQSAYVIITFSTISETGPFAFEWLRNDTFGKELVDPITGKVFPNLKNFWPQINQDGADQAIVFLQEESEANTRGTVSFFGIPVERNLAIYAGPVVCFSILLFLCLHLRHFRLMAAGTEAINIFPWVPFFKGALAFWVAFVTILVLPVIANTFLLYRFGHWTEWSTKIGIASDVFILGTGTWAMYEVSRLRKQSSG